MSNIDKRALLERARDKVKSLEFAVTQTAFADSRAELEVELELARIALASLEAEAVAYTDAEELRFPHATSDMWPVPLGHGMDLPLYAAPPSPVAPDLKELEDILDWILMLPCPTPKATHFAKRLAVVIDTCRAAMLQGADGNSPVIPDGWVACSERMPSIGVPVITCCGDVVQYAAYAWDGKEWQDWYEEYDKLPASTFTHWHPRPAAPQQEVTQALAKGMERYGDAMQELAKKEVK